MVVLLAPASSEAWIWRFIDELSGPGKFVGAELDMRLLCFPPPKGQTPKDRGSSDAKARGAGLVGVTPCIWPAEASKHEHRFSINLGVSASWAIDNPLLYERPDASRRVVLVSAAPSVRWRMFPALEVGAGISIDAYDAAQTPVVWRWSVEFPQAVFKPGALVQKWAPKPGEVDLRQILGVEYVLIRTTRGFVAEDFGAIPGTFSVGPEWRNSWAVVVDFAPFFRQGTKTNP
jgi:hypothetical protein